MKFNLTNKEDIDEAKLLLDKLIEKKCNIELIRKYPPRSLHQNNYCHLLLSYCAMEMGETLDYFKDEIWKKIIAPSVFETTYINTKTNKERSDWRSSADISSHDMTIAIEKLIKWAGENLNLTLPSADNYEYITRIQNEIEKNKKWM